MKKRVFDIIQIGNREDAPSRLFDYLLIAAVLMNIAAMFLETFASLSDLNPLFKTVETVTVLFFIVEYVLRLWTAPYLYMDEKPGRAVVKYMTSFDGVVSLLAILPFFFLSGFILFRMMRIVRILKLFKINEQFDSLHVIKTVMYEKRNQIVSSIFIIVVLMLASSLCMYSAEHEAQPDVFENAFSGIWWSVSALFTVGYGDICPITTVGKIMAIFISFLGVGVVAIPTGIISAGFVENYTEMINAAGSRDITTVVVDIDSSWIGYTMEELKEKTGFTVVLVRRRERSLMPYRDPDLNVELDDVLYLYQEVSRGRDSRRKMETK